MSFLASRSCVAILAASILTLSASAQSSAPTANSAYYFGTLAGSPSRGTADGAGGAARFSGPAGMAFDANGNLFVADGFSHTIRKISPAGVVSTLAGSPLDRGFEDGTGSAARFTLPRAVLLHTDGNLYVGDTATVRRVTSSGAVNLLAGKSGNPLVDGTGATAGFDAIIAVESASENSLFVCDQRTIRRVTLDGVVTTFFTKDQLWINSQFGAMVRDGAGNLYVANNGIEYTAPNDAPVSRARIFRISPGGSPQLVADESSGLADIRRITALAIDANGILHAATESAVLRVANGVSVLAGSTTTRGARDGATAEALFDGIEGIEFDGAGNLLVSEWNNTIRRVSPSGVVSTFAGLSEQDSAGHVDARGSAARFDSPYAIAVAADGVCYVADRNNHVIRRIDANGNVTTFAGGVGQPGYLDLPRTDARFKFPHGIARDAAGNLYVIEDSGGVRKISPTGVVTTLAGSSQRGTSPYQNGTGSAATFGWLTSIAVAANGDVYVGEARSFSAQLGSTWAHLRRITPDGTVSTSRLLDVEIMPHSSIDGLAFDSNGNLFAADSEYQVLIKLTPQGTTERWRPTMFAPFRIATDSAGRVFATDGPDFSSTRVGRFQPNGTFDVIGGEMYRVGHRDDLGRKAGFDDLRGIAVDAAGTLYLIDANNTIRKAVAASAPTFVTQPANQTVAQGAAATFSASVAAVPEAIYQWFLNGTPVPGATAATFTLPTARSSDAGAYHVVATNAAGSATSQSATLTVTAASSAPPSAGGGGGGAPSIWFLIHAALLALAKRIHRKIATASAD